jgi:hypothetical protein
MLMRKRFIVVERLGRWTQFDGEVILSETLLDAATYGRVLANA